MRTLIALALVAGCTGLFAQSQPQSTAADRATAQGTVTCNVIRPIKLTHVEGASLNFGGTYCDTNQSGWVCIATDGSRWIDCGGVSLRAAEPGSADKFIMTGDTRYSVAFTLPGDDYWMNGPGGHKMKVRIKWLGVNGKQYIGNAGPIAGVPIWGPDGKSEITVGGIAEVGGDSVTPGVYTGTYDLMVAYN